MGCSSSSPCCGNTIIPTAKPDASTNATPEVVIAPAEVKVPISANPQVAPGGVNVTAKIVAAEEVAPVTPDSTIKAGVLAAVKTLNIIHFNDVYNIEARSVDPVGGASKFVTKVREMAKENNALILFAGDAFSPSIMSTLTKGEQMPPVLNNIGVHVSAVGNHDLDFGVERMTELIGQCDCKWLMANVLTKDEKAQFPGTKPYTIMEWGGVKVGIVGLVEYEWLATLASLEVSDVHYIDFVEEGLRLEKLLRSQGCEIVVALTHMRVPNDQRLGREVPGIDIILGGHDHHYEVSQCEPQETLLFKSGTDFREFTLINMTLNGQSSPKVEHERVYITSDIPDDPDTSAIVDKYLKMVGEKMELPLGFTAAPMDGRFAVVRTQESNLGNLLTDIARIMTGCDVVMLNSGTFRSDQVHEGPLLNKDLVSILPMLDEMCTIEITGDQIVEALENSVCMYPKMEGRFCQVSGMCFEFNPTAEPGERIIKASIQIGGKPLEASKAYTLATKAYLAQGKDGFDVFKQCKMLQDAEDSAHLPTIVNNHFDSITRLNTRSNEIGADRASAGTAALEARLVTLAEEAALTDKSAIIRWSDDRAEYVVDPRVEGRIITVGTSATDAWALE